jgi:hypothetical protein
MPSWIPGDDYLTNFHKGDPYIKVEEGYARLPGAGYAALHPELEGVDPEDYPDIDKLRILGAVAPYSREYQKLHDRRRLGPSPAATYICPRTHAKAASHCTQSPCVWISPLRRPGNTSFPTSTSTYEPLRTVHSRLPSCCLGVLHRCR